MDLSRDEVGGLVEVDESKAFFETWGFGGLGRILGKAERGVGEGGEWFEDIDGLEEWSDAKCAETGFELSGIFAWEERGGGRG